MYWMPPSLYQSHIGVFSWYIALKVYFLWIYSWFTLDIQAIVFNSFHWVFTIWYKAYYLEKVKKNIVLSDILNWERFCKVVGYFLYIFLYIMLFTWVYSSFVYSLLSTSSIWVVISSNLTRVIQCVLLYYFL